MPKQRREGFGKRKRTEGCTEEAQMPLLLPLPAAAVFSAGVDGEGSSVMSVLHKGVMRCGGCWDDGGG